MLSQCIIESQSLSEKSDCTMHLPVALAAVQDGESYEREYIQRWIDEKQAELAEAQQEQ